MKLRMGKNLAKSVGKRFIQFKQIEHLSKQKLFATKLILIFFLAIPLLSSCILQTRQLNTAPSVRIVSPQNSEVFVASELRISIEAEDAEKNISSIKLFQDGQAIGEASRSLLQGQTQDPSLPERWHFNWTAPQSGSYVFSAEATDQFGQKAMASVSFNVVLPVVNNPSNPVDAVAYQAYTDNLTLWKSQAVNTYVIDFQRICFCLPDLTQPVQLNVVNNNLSNAIYLSGAAVNQNNYSHFYTVDKAFSLIEEAFTKNAAEIRVVYHDIHGFPTNVFIDYDKLLADEELQFNFSNFVAN